MKVNSVFLFSRHIFCHLRRLFLFPLRSPPRSLLSRSVFSHASSICFWRSARVHCLNPSASSLVSTLTSAPYAQWVTFRFPASIAGPCTNFQASAILLQAKTRATSRNLFTDFLLEEQGKSPNSHAPIVGSSMHPTAAHMSCIVSSQNLRSWAQSQVMCMNSESTRSHIWHLYPVSPKSS